MTYSIVVAKYKENVDWLGNYIDKYPIFLYDKSKPRRSGCRSAASACRAPGMSPRSRGFAPSTTSGLK